MCIRDSYKACWIESDDPAELEAFKKRKYQYMAKDREGRDVFLADSGYVLQLSLIHIWESGTAICAPEVSLPRDGPRPCGGRKSCIRLFRQ